MGVCFSLWANQILCKFDNSCKIVQQKWGRQREALDNMLLIILGRCYLIKAIQTAAAGHGFIKNAQWTPYKVCLTIARGWYTRWRNESLRKRDWPVCRLWGKLLTMIPGVKDCHLWVGPSLVHCFASCCPRISANPQTSISMEELLSRCITDIAAAEIK